MHLNQSRVFERKKSLLVQLLVNKQESKAWTALMERVVKFRFFNWYVRGRKDAETELKYHLSLRLRLS